MRNINEDLLEIYSKYWDGLKTGMKDIDTVNLKVSFPLLLNVFPEYLKSEVKVLFIGQQTYGWGVGKNKDYFGSYDSEDILNELRDSYRSSILERNIQKAHSGVQQIMSTKN